MSKDVTKALSGVILVARKAMRLGLLERVTSHLASRPVKVSSIEEADLEVMRKEPDAVIVDVSDMKSGEFEGRLGHFLLQLPGWVKTFLIDSHPTVSRVKKASQLGVDGILRQPISHHGITTLVGELTKKRDPPKN